MCFVCVSSSLRCNTLQRPACWTLPRDLDESLCGRFPHKGPLKLGARRRRETCDEAIVGLTSRGLKNVLVLNIVGEENDQQFNAARRWGRYRRPRYVTVLTALPTFPPGAPVRIGLHLRRCEGGCRYAPDRGPPSGKSRVVINPIQTRLADWLHAQRRRTTRLVALTSTVRGSWPKSVAEGTTPT